MEDIRRQCYKILDLIEESQYKEEDNYSIVRMKKELNKLLDELSDENNTSEININVQSLARHFADDTCDYFSNILIELDRLSEKVENIVQ